MIWYQLLLISIQKGYYVQLGKPLLGRRDYDLAMLWALVQEMEQARVSDGQPS